MDASASRVIGVFGGRSKRSGRFLSDAATSAALEETPEGAEGPECVTGGNDAASASGVRALDLTMRVFSFST